MRTTDDGQISKAEFRAFLVEAGANDVGDYDIELIFDKADADGNGVITQDELLDALSS